jgi:hypothetical protein
VKVFGTADAAQGSRIGGGFQVGSEKIIKSYMPCGSRGRLDVNPKAKTAWGGECMRGNNAMHLQKTANIIQPGKTKSTEETRKAGQREDR